MVRPDLQAGQSFLYRQYYVVDDLDSIDDRANLLVEDSYQEKFDLGDMPGRKVRLFALEGRAKFSATVNSISCGRGEEICSGLTTPQVGYRPLYYVECGSTRYTGSDPYALSPQGPPFQAYVCQNDPAVVPKWDLLGWFVEGVCDSLTYSEYDDHLCWELSDIPSMAPSSVPSFQPSDVPSALPSISDAPTRSDFPSLEPTINPTLGDFLDKALMEDMIPEGSSMCVGSGKTSFTFDYTEKDPGKWHRDSRPFEEQLFLAELSHEDDDSNREWSIRIGSGSNIYSFVGPFGESVPPQKHPNAPWVDEVWQSVAVNHHLHQPDVNDYFIHQAGSYQRDAPYTDTPFFSPNVAKFCEKRECSFASWGQHGHVPTIFESALIYHNKYKDCGDGVLEFTSVFHNAAELPGGPEDLLDYLNVPWGGVKTTVLKDILIAEPGGGSSIIDPIPRWHDNIGILEDTTTTGGYTIFTEDLVSDEAPTGAYSMPRDSGGNCLSLTIAGGGCSESSGHTGSLGYYTMKCAVQQTISLSSGCRTAVQCSLSLINPRNNESMEIIAVLHWADGGNTFYFNPVGTASEFNSKFSPGDDIVVEYYDFGKPPEDNLALTLVHGSTPLDRSWMKATTRLRWGWGGEIYRDYTAYTVNARPLLSAGRTYFYRQYFIVDEFLNMDNRGAELAPEAYQGIRDAGELPGRAVALYSHDASSFGAAVLPGGHCAGIKRCEGKTTPQTNTRPLFHIQCGGQSYVGSDLYHFAPAGTPRRPYLCDGETNDVRATWKLLGYFVQGSCEYLNTATYESDYCDVHSNAPSVTPSNVPTRSIQPSVAPSSTPSISPSVAPSVSPTILLTSMPSLTPSLTPSSTPSEIPTGGGLRTLSDCEDDGGYMCTSSDIENFMGVTLTCDLYDINANICNVRSCLEPNVQPPSVGCCACSEF